MASQPPIVGEVQDLARHVGTHRQRIEFLEARPIGEPSGTATGLIDAHESAADPHPQYSSGAGVTDGDKGDIVVSGGGAVWTLDAGIAATFEANGTAGAVIAAHLGASDPHAQYLTVAEGVAAFAPIGHLHALGHVTGLVTALAGKEPSLTTGTTAQYIRGDKSLATLDKSAVGLANVDNTSDASKPVSSATTTALDGKQPLSTVLSNTTAAFTTAQETKLAGVATGATANATDAQLRDRATHTGAQAISTVTGLQGALDGKQAAGSYQPADPQLTALAALDYAGNATKVVRVNAAADGFELATVGGGAVTLAAARIRRTTNQSIPTGAGWTDVIWESSAYQIGGAFWTSDATITAGVTGLLQLFVEGTMDGSGLLGTINAEMRILLNGTDEIAADFKQVFVNVPASLWCMAQRQFAATDTFKVQVRHTNATAVNLLAEGNHSPDFILAQVGGAKGDPGAAALTGIATMQLPVSPARPRRDHSETIIAAGVTALSRMFVTLAPVTDLDENDPALLGPVSFSATPDVGTFDIFASFQEPVHGPVKIQWSAL